MMATKIRCAIVGCGRISKNHFDALQACSDDFELIAACDNKEENLKRAREDYGIQAIFTDMLEMLEQVELDLVILCTPSGLHADQAYLAAEQGCHVVSEKPMATQWADALRMVEVCERNHVQLFVVKQNRLNPTIQALKQVIEAGAFGKLYMVQSNVFWTRPQSYYDQATWRGTWAQDGGALMNQASHYLDLLQWLVGKVDYVHAISATLARKIEAEDTIALNLKWKNGTIGSMAVTMLAYPKNLEGSITLIGEKGTVKIGGVALNQIEQWVFEDKSIINFEQVSALSYDSASVYGSGHLPYYQNVNACLQGKAKPLVDGNEGLKSLELIVASYRSAKENAIVRLPLQRKE